MMSETGMASDRPLSTREMIAEVKLAIHKLVTGRIKSYQIGRRTITYYSIKELKDYLRDLEEQLAIEEQDPSLMSGVHVAYFDRR